MNSNITNVRVGDRFVWFRAGNDDHCVVTEVKIKDGKPYANLKVDGWVSTGGWEFIDFHFMPEAEYIAMKAKEKADKAAKV